MSRDVSRDILVLVVRPGRAPRATSPLPEHLSAAGIMRRATVAPTTASLWRLSRGSGRHSWPSPPYGNNVDTPSISIWRGVVSGAPASSVRSPRTGAQSKV